MTLPIDSEPHTAHATQPNGLGLPHHPLYTTIMCHQQAHSQPVGARLPHHSRHTATMQGVVCLAWMCVALSGSHAARDNPHQQHQTLTT
jgi:hypothetical protein